MKIDPEESHGKGEKRRKCLICKEFSRSSSRAQLTSNDSSGAAVAWQWRTVTQDRIPNDEIGEEKTRDLAEKTKGMNEHPNEIYRIIEIMNYRIIETINYRTNELSNYRNKE